MSDGQITEAATLESELRDLLTELNSRFSFRDWSKICSSLDVIGDTFEAILSFEHASDSTFTQYRYLFLYGLLEALYLQNVAIRDIADVLKIVADINKIEKEKYDYVTDLRNNIAAHPSSKGDEKHWFVPRSKLSKNCFEVVHYVKADYEAERKTIVVSDVLAKHCDVVSRRMECLITKAKKL